MKTIFSKIAKRIVLFFSIFTLLTFPVFAQTELSGTISKDSTLVLANSPYLISSSLTIQNGYTLTVESGVTVKFGTSSNLYILGTLNATNVIFTSNNSTPTPGNWGQIQTGDYSNSGLVNLTDCKINYAHLFYVYNGTATLVNTDISNSLYEAVVVENLGILNMTGGLLSTTSTNAMSYNDGISARTNTSITLNGVYIQNYNNGIGLNTDATANISNMNISACNYPICYHDVANLSVSGVNFFTGANYVAVKIEFSNLYKSMTLPLINIPYYFIYGFHIQTDGILNVSSNNILKFQPGYTLNVDGTLIANAADGEYIYFSSNLDDNWGGDTNKDGTTTAPRPNDWYGIYFNNNSQDANCLLHRCMVRYAGANNRGGINTIDASPTIDMCNISNNYIGIYMQGTSNPTLTNNTIGSSLMTPLAMSFEANPMMSNNTLSFSDNAYDAIGIIGGTMTANGTLKVRAFTDVPNITYLILDEITVPVGKTLTINKGITIKSYSPDWYYHRIIVNGSLIANATSDSIINFTSARDDNYGYPADCNKDGTITSPSVGDWGGIIFNSGSAGTLNYCRIKYAKIYYYSFSTCSSTEYINEAAIGIIDASPTISNCEFNNLNYAISCYRSASPSLTNNSMVNVLYTPINIAGPSNPSISGITFTNVGWRAMGLLGGNVCLNGTIKKRDVAGFTNITYVLLSDMTINSGTYVNVEPGVVIKINNPNGYTQSSIFIDGGFKTDGTSSQKVVLTSIKDDNEGNPYDTNGDGNASTPAAGDWGSVKFRSTSDDSYCILNNCRIKFPGNTNEGAVTFENAAGKLKNSTLTNSSNYGVYCNGNSTTLIDSVVIQNCGLDPVAMSLTSNPAFSNITFTSNNSQAIKIIEGTLSSVATLTPRNMAGITNIAYVVDQLTISNNAKLTISPDVVVKFRGGGNTYIKVNGNLIANGTSDHKIYFTSFKDDSKGGDSNNNGNTDSPQKGDWGQGYLNWTYHWDETPGGIKFENNTLVSDTVNSLKYCEISYPTTGVRVENAHATIANSILQLCKSFGATVAGSANPDFNNCQFYNINYTPVEMSMFSTPTFTNNTALNVGYMAIGIIPETYSQSATIPVRDFGGYTNINYLMEGPCTINSGSTITIPAGVVFKSTDYISTSTYDHYWSNPATIANGFIVNGGLKIEGTQANPVIFTNAQDDSYGNPADMNQNGMATLAPDGSYSNWNGNWITFNDVSDDASSVNNAILKFGNMGISTLSASPTINNTRFEKLYYGVDMSGVSAPKIDNCSFNDLQYYPIQISLVSYPASSTGNLISGSTYKVIKVRDEVLTQDVVLPKRDFGGKTNIPYFFQKYEIGTSASLTINPGVICKFMKQSYWDTSYLNISKGLIAQGGSTPDSTIIFTSLLDDFYGGDSNADSTKTLPSTTDWSGLNFVDQSLDPLCNLKNCVVRFANSGVNTTSASPTITNCSFNNNAIGANITGASNPTFNNCDFSGNHDFGIKNVDKSFNIDATQCWWGSNTGPILSETASDGNSEQEYVTSSVNYTPWKTTGAINPLTGDVSLNGLIQAFDASLVLKNTVGLLTLSPIQEQVADVSGTAGITAYDASLILQYVVGMDATFPINKVKKSTVDLSSVALSIGSISVDNSNEFTVPLSVANMDGLMGADIKLKFNPQYLQAVAVDNLLSSMFMEFNIDNVNGLITIAMARSVSLNGSETLANLKLKAIASASIVTDISVERFLANEQDFTYAATPGSITIMKSGTGFATTLEDNPQGMAALYPNPFKDEARLVYQLDENSKWVKIDLFNLLGQKVAGLVDEYKAQGTYSIKITNKDYPLESGTYVIRMQTANYTESQLFQVSK